MVKKWQKNKARIIAGLALVLILILIRTYENNWFYDPFLSYYKQDISHLPLPVVNYIALFLSLGFRYYLNSMVSLGILYVIFKDYKIVKFSVFLYSLFGMILMILFFFIMIKFGQTNKMNLFYIRRFIIQPIFLMLFIPAFYYQKRMK